MLPDIYPFAEYKYTATIPTARFIKGVAGEVFEWIFKYGTRNCTVNVGDKSSIV